MSFAEKKKPFSVRCYQSNGSNFQNEINMFHLKGKPKQLPNYLIQAKNYFHNLKAKL